VHPIDVNRHKPLVNMKSSIAAAKTLTKEINYPTPPLCAVSADMRVQYGEKVIVELGDGRNLIGKLAKFDPDKGNVGIELEGESSVQHHGMHEIRVLRIPTPRRWIMDEDSILTQAKGIKVTTDPLEYEIEFNDHTSIEGNTFGFRNGRYGIHLFPVHEQNQYTHLFVPNGAISRHRIGKPLGQQLVKDEVVTVRDMAITLMEQQEHRTRSLGEHLAAMAVVSPQQLEKSLKRQASMPHLQLGEILIQDKLITAEQLEGILIEQKRQRHLALGDLLIAKGLVQQEDIQKSLASKLGFPFVNLHQFPLDMTALNLIDKEFATNHKVLPLHHHQDKLVVAMIDPTKWDSLDALQTKTGLGIEPVIATDADILWAINYYFKDSVITTHGVNAKRQDMAKSPLGEEETQNYLLAVGQTLNHEGAVDFLRSVILDSARRGITHLHFEPTRNRGAIVRLRKDGDLVEAGEIPEVPWKSVLSEVRTLAGLEPERRSRAQLISIDTHFLEPALIDIQLAILPNIDGGEELVLKIDASNYAPRLRDIGLSEHNMKRLLELSDKPRGLILVAGAYDSGKSTTLSALLTQLNNKNKKIWVIGEEGRKMPEGIRQIPLSADNRHGNFTAFDIVLHADPDIIMISDLFGPVTAQKALSAALTNHLIFSAITVGHAVEAVERLFNMRLPNYEIADALLAVVAQRLVKKLCTHCKRRHTPSTEELRMLVAEYCAEAYGENEPAVKVKNLHEKTLHSWTETYTKPSEELRIYRAVGCKHCNNSGYDGRIALNELLEITPTIRRTLLDGADTATVFKAAMASGMKTLRQDGIEKILQGHTDITQVRSACSR
jgi:type II secretory ATPase GspE/PulE/Tfp pilus assembly ATPase PilB-like protein